MLEKLKKELFDKIPNNATVAIFGASKPQELMYNDLKKIRPDVKVSCFIDNFLKKTGLDKPVVTLKQFIDNKEECDRVLMMTSKDASIINGILHTFKYKTITKTPFVRDYYKYSISDKDVWEMFKSEEDRKLYRLLYDIRMKYKETSELDELYEKMYAPEERPSFKLDKQYIDKVNKEAIKTVFDLGFNSGTNAIPFMNFFPNLEKIYGFEAIYNTCREKWIEDFFIDSNKVEIVNYAAGEQKGEINFLINVNCPSGSFSQDISTKNNRASDWEKRTVNMIDIDSFTKERNIKVDFIKMDIEGAELSALKGGIGTIQKQRPQLAISIYHSMEDFINIPLYLKENLKDYVFRLGHYGKSGRLILSETVFYAIPKELA